MRPAWVLGAALACSQPAPVSADVWPTSIARVERGLTSPDTAVRRDAARRLEGLPPSQVRQILPLALKDPDPEVRLAAGHASIRAGIDAKVEAEVWLSDADPAVRQVAAQMLGVGVLPPSAVTLLARTLSDPVPAVRLEAARALANAPADDGARVLLNHLDDAQETFVLAVVEALITLRSESAVVPLLGKVSDPRVNVRRAVVRALGEFQGSNQVTMPLVLALADSDAEVRRIAIESIVAAQAFDAMPALEERVRHDRDVDVQVAALDGLLALGELGPTEPARARAAAVAIECLGHERQELRSEALEGLSQHAGAARQELRSCLTGATGEVVGRCALALAHDHEPGNAELFVAAWRQGRILAPDLLGALAVQQGDQSLQMVLELLKSRAPGVRTRAIEVMGELLTARGGDGRAVEPIVEALHDAQSPVDVEALVDVLGRTGAVRAVRHLVPFLAASNRASLRLAAVRGLGEIRGAEVPVGVVEELLTSDDAALRTATVLALREGEWQGTTRLLLGLLQAAGTDEAESLAVALWGSVRHLREPSELAQLEALVHNANSRLRDALLEALARVDWSLSAPAWRRLASAKSCAASAKVAEVLGAYPEAVPLLIPMTAGRCPRTLANAVWSLGYHGDAATAARVRPLVNHGERAVAGNAVATLARIAARTGKASESRAVLCEQVHLATLGPNAARAANALFGLRSTAQRCGDGADERTLLRTAAAPQVRAQAAWLLHAVPDLPDVERKALFRCVQTDADGEVASACVAARDDDTSSVAVATRRATTILVVPPTRSKPAPDVPFTLLTEYGAYRFGWTDARGAVWLQTEDSEAVSASLPVGQW